MTCTRDFNALKKILRPQEGLNYRSPYLEENKRNSKNETAWNSPQKPDCESTHLIRHAEWRHQLQTIQTTSPSAQTLHSECQNTGGEYISTPGIDKQE
jgi:hypothetical protein